MRRFPVLLALSASMGSVAIRGQPSGVWLDVPFVKQQKNGCGAASVSMVIEYWISKGARVPQDSANASIIQQALYSREAKGIFGSGMERYFEGAGFRAFVFKAGWVDLKQHLSKGRPLIVCLRANSGAAHYVVVAGLDWQRGLVLVNDPARRKLLKLDQTSFEKGWSAAQNWTLLALPR
jgi:predicted double-glycine peptidase